jgi:hypothetical protein
MSHISAITLRIKDSKALLEAAEELGLEQRLKGTYKWYGRSVGDYPLPEGYTEDELGKCLFALGIKGNHSAYEIGVVKSKIHPGEYEMLWDFWNGGFGLQEAIGEQGNKLRQRYAEKVTTKQLRKQGLRVTRSVTDDGKVVLRGRR